MARATSPKSQPHFSPALFSYLADLRAHNERDWFLANKQRYEDAVKAPLLAFLEAFRPRLFAISRHFVVGAPFRINRDIRFSKDKSPYKTHAAAHARHETTDKDVHGAGFYLHLEPGNVFTGVGMWEPDTRTIGKVRDAIVNGPAAWKRIVGGKKFSAQCTLEGTSLKRVPTGYDKDHPLADDLKRKSFIAVAHFDERAACQPDFLDRYVESCDVAAPLARFLTTAVGLPF